MSPKKLFNIIFDTKVAILEFIEQQAEGLVLIFHARLHAHQMRCSCCKSKNVSKEKSAIRKFRGSNLNSTKTYLQIKTYKFYCRDCKKRAWVQLPFAMGKLPMTRAFVNYVIELSAMSTLLHVALLLGLQWKTVKNIDKAYLKGKAKQFSYKKLRYLSVDEIAIRKGHNYMTVISDIETGKIIYAVEGRKEEDLRFFLRRLAKKAKNLRAIAMDMSKSYISAVKKHLPHVCIIFDRFHVTKVLTEMVDKVRKAEWSRLQSVGMTVGKGDRFLFLSNPENLEGSQQDTLNKLLELNKVLCIAYIMKEQFRLFWKCETKNEAIQFFTDWYALAGTCGVPGVRKAADTLFRHLGGLLNYFDYRIDNGKAEGINNKIKTMKRQSYGDKAISFL